MLNRLEEMIRDLPRYDVVLGPPGLNERAAYGFYGYADERLSVKTCWSRIRDSSPI